MMELHRIEYAIGNISKMPVTEKGDFIVVKDLATGRTALFRVDSEKGEAFRVTSLNPPLTTKEKTKNEK